MTNKPIDPGYRSDPTRDAEALTREAQRLGIIRLSPDALIRGISLVPEDRAMPGARIEVVDGVNPMPALPRRESRPGADDGFGTTELLPPQYDDGRCEARHCRRHTALNPDPAIRVTSVSMNAERHYGKNGRA